MKTAIVILAAGIGSRFGIGVKQLTPVGPGGKLIIDYSIHDALEAGFNEVVFIIRPDLRREFDEMIGDRLTGLVGRYRALERVSYVYQELTDLPEGFGYLANERLKPWGTGQAILACRGAVQVPFAVINADDYYGKQAFRDIHAFLLAHGTERGHYCMAGFTLGNTLSEYGAVTRGLCRVEEAGCLTEITETRGIEKTPDGAVANGVPLDPDSTVSMNMWGFTPDFLEELEVDFRRFLESGNALSGEFLLPTLVGERLESGKIRVECLKTAESWFGVTYQADRAYVQQRILELIAAGVYPERLYPE
ncbi:MAG: NTP transferase domain-containing protein [Oscillospiraceae bacterium]|nr:NTP transferase domain-containing protein [Oscillospiraceae bacterium]